MNNIVGADRGRRDGRGIYPPRFGWYPLPSPTPISGRRMFCDTYFLLIFGYTIFQQIHSKYDIFYFEFSNAKTPLCGRGLSFPTPPLGCSAPSSVIPPPTHTLEEDTSVNVYLPPNYFLINNIPRNPPNVCNRSLSLHPPSPNANSLMGGGISQHPSLAQSLRSLAGHLPLEEDTCSVNMYFLLYWFFYRQYSNKFIQSMHQIA